MAMTRPQIKAEIKERIKHVIEELWGVEPEHVTCEIFTREAKMVIDNIIVLSKEDLWKLSHRAESGDAANLSSVDSGEIRMFLHCNINLSDQGLFPDYG